MKRKFEKRLALVGASWQIVSGLITVFIYSMWVRGQAESLTTGSSQFKVISSQVLAKNLYTFTVTFGILFIGIGLLNLYLIKKLSEKKIEKKIPIWFLIIGIICFFLMDFISCFTFIGAGLLALAKNKAISYELQQ